MNQHQSKSINNRQKFNQNQQKIVQNSILEGLGAILGSPNPFWDRFWTPVGAHVGSLLKPSGGHVGAMLVQKLILGGPGWLSKSTMKFDTFSNRFGTDFGSILDSKMEPQMVQDRSQERS